MTILLVDEIRQELQDTLTNDPNNYSKILDLSNQLAKFDKNKVRFSVDAGIINRLGKELVARHETAVSELVKNAYDADATKVELIFKESSVIGGILIIEDNGLGMTEEQLINGFMRLSSSDKVHYPRSPRYDRKRAGRKGIGRFSTQRLGTKLTIITQTIEAEQALKVTINWDSFLEDMELSFITNDIEYTDKQKNEGTTLIIEQLRDSWSEAQIKRVYRYASETIQPFPIAESDSKILNDPGFKLKCIEINNGNKHVIANEETMFFEHAMAEIDGKVDNDGYIYLNITSKKLNYKQEEIVINKNEPFKFLKNITLKAYYFIYNIGMIPKQTETSIREKAKEQGGIRLYRNGFRVLPYGESEDDWLGLDASVRKRETLPPHGNINFFGFVEINNDTEEQFEELSSREGLIENDTLNELEDFGYKVLIDSIRRIGEFRGRKVTAGQKDWKKKPEEIITEAVDVLKEVKISLESEKNLENKTLEKKLEKITENIQIAQEQEKVQKIELIKEMNLLRVLAGLGLTIGEFIHEIKQYQGALQHDIRSIENSNSLEKVLEINQRVENNLDGLSTYISYFDEAFSENVQRELKPIELRTVVHALEKTLKADISKRKIEFVEPIFHGYNLYTIPMHKSEWASILFNFYTNSRKAIKRDNNIDGKIFIECGKLDNKVYLEFSDNGDGIPVDSRDKIFNAFYTTSTPIGKIAKHHEEITGTGLGLKIVKDIITSYGGSIFVKEPANGYNTTIRIELPWDKDGYKSAL
ncbi:MAG: sensor histidine kinase [Candidatus Marithrix sp.]